MRRTGTRTVVAVALWAVAAAVAPGAVIAAAPGVEQMVVFRSGEAAVGKPRAAGTTVRIGKRRCAVASATPLAALVRSDVDPVRLRDFGSCSRRPRDGGGLFVTGIGADRNSGLSGWVYKVGNRLGTAGAADPTGPFGSGRLRAGTRVTWFYCRVPSNCQRTLVTRARVEPGGVVVVRVTAHNDQGRGIAAREATVRLGTQSAVTDSSGDARFTVAPGTYTVHAEQADRIRSFPERVRVE